jgi:hypothetical protein
MVTKVKDGLFMEDIEAAQDPDFIELNKISRIINCAAGQVSDMRGTLTISRSHTEV